MKQLSNNTKINKEINYSIIKTMNIETLNGLVTINYSTNIIDFYIDTLKNYLPLNGINIGYLKEYPIEKLLEETNFKKLKNYTLYEKAFRTYKIKHISMVKAIEWETSSARRERKKSERKSNQLDK